MTSHGKIATAGGILLKDNKILLGKRQPYMKLSPNVWDIIGGHPEGNETPEQTLVRELEEELGITATKFKLIAVLPMPFFDVHVFLVTAWLGTPQNLPEGHHSELGWFSISEAVKLDLALDEYQALLRGLEPSGEERAGV